MHSRRQKNRSKIWSYFCVIKQQVYNKETVDIRPKNSLGASKIYHLKYYSKCAVYKSRSFAYR